MSVPRRRPAWVHPWLLTPAAWAAVVTGALVLAMIAVREPVLAAGAAAFGVIGLLVAIVPDAAAAVAVFLIYSNVAVVAVRFHGAPRVAAQAVVLLLAIPFLHEVVFRRRGFVLHPALPLLCLFIAVGVVGLAFSSDVGRSSVTMIEWLLEGLLVFFLVTNAVRTPRALRWATWSLLAAGLAMAAVPIYQQLTGAFESNFGGFGQTTDVGFRTGEVTVEGEVRQVRLSGPIGEQNRYAQCMLMLVPLGFFAAAGSMRRLPRLAALGLAGVAAVGSALSFSRGAAVAFVLTVAALVTVRMVTWKQVALVAVAGALFLAATPQYWKRIATITGVAHVLGGPAAATEEPDGAIQGRATEMIAAAQVFADHPLIGVGPGMFQAYSRIYGNRLGIRRLEENRESHSLYLGIAAETGIIGLTCLLGAVGLTLWGLLRCHRRWERAAPEFAGAAAGYFGALMAYLTTGLSMHLSYIRFFFLILGLAAAVTTIAGTSRLPAVASPEPAEPPEPPEPTGGGSDHG